jgi:hypothetical protein
LRLPRRGRHGGEARTPPLSGEAQGSPQVEEAVERLRSDERLALGGGGTRGRRSRKKAGDTPSCYLAVLTHAAASSNVHVKRPLDRSYLPGTAEKARSAVKGVGERDGGGEKASRSQYRLFNSNKGVGSGGQARHSARGLHPGGRNAGTLPGEDTASPGPHSLRESSIRAAMQFVAAHGEFTVHVCDRGAGIAVFAGGCVL